MDFGIYISLMGIVMVYTNALQIQLPNWPKIQRNKCSTQNKIRSNEVDFCSNLSITTTSYQEQTEKIENAPNQTAIKNLIFLILTPADNFTIESVAPPTLIPPIKSYDVCVDGLQELLNISRRKAEMLFNSNMHMYAFSVNMPVNETHQKIVSQLSTNIGKEIKFIGNVRPMIKCAKQNVTVSNLSINGSTRGPLSSSTSFMRLDPNQIIITKTDIEGPTSPWGDLGIKTTRPFVDIIETTRKRIKTTIKTSSVPNLSSTFMTTLNPTTKH